MSGDNRAKELVDLGNKLFTKKRQLDNLNQEIAWQFAPDLADFNTELTLGEDWAADRMDGYPEQVSRDLSNSLSAMLRPQDRPWFKTTTLDEEVDKDEENSQYLSYVTMVIRKSLYDPRSKFIRATKETDRFYVNFGQGVLSIEEAPETRDYLFFRNHHLRDCAWLENELQDIDHLHRKDRMTARAMIRKFGENKLHRSIKEAHQKDPGKEFEIRIVVLPSEEYDMTAKAFANGKKSSRLKKLPFVICYIDVENCKIIREGGLREFPYVVPRWHRFARSQYAFSPAAMPALADARMAQMLSQILLEAGEKAVDPPMIGKQEIVIGEPNIAAGGLSWVDIEHDASLKEALDIIKIDADMRVGFEMRRDIREMLAKSFFLDKLTLPEAGAQMTATEVQRRLEEHVRNLMPLFEPMQVEYNTRLLDLAFGLLRNMKKFGTHEMPDGLSGANISWAFESPIQQAQDRVMVEQFKASLEVVAMAMQAGAKSSPIHIESAQRDAIRGVGGPAEWRKTQDEQAAEAEENAKQAMMAQAMMEAQQGAQIAGQVGDAGQKLGLIPPPTPGIDAATQQAGDLGQEVDAAEAIQALAEASGGDEEQSQEITMAQPAPIELADIMTMMRRLSIQIDALTQQSEKPRRITINRDKSGKITEAIAA